MTVVQSPQRTTIRGTERPAIRGTTYTGAWGGFLRAHATLVRRLDAELKEAHGLPLFSYEVLLRLSWAPGHRMQMGELAESLLLTLCGVSQPVSRLESEGLVQIEPYPKDRQRTYAVLTEAGLDRLGEAHPTHLAGVHKHFLEHFSEEELKTMAQYWRRVLSGA
jgi:DNA-binding MarR family transcriptional regulator